MLTNISLKNFALIDKLEIEFFDMFNTLTGETGAGKSILVDAVGLCLGGRASSSYIRSGAEKCTIIATFDVTGIDAIKALLDEYGLEYDNNLIIEREISRTGRNLCRINSKITPLRILNEIGKHLVSIYGQNEHTQLLKANYQLQLIDQWGGRIIEELKEDISLIIDEINCLEKRLENIGMDQSLMARELDMLQFQIKEIEEANLVDGELEELENESQFMKNAEEIFLVLNDIDSLFSSDFEVTPFFERLGDMARDLDNISKYDSELKPILEMMNSVYYDMQELDNINKDYQLKFDFDPDRLRSIEARLNTIHSLRKKYGNTFDDIKNYLENAYERVDLLANSEEKRAKLKIKIEELKQTYFTKAKRLSDNRQNYANEFAKLIENGISDLGMEHAKLQISLLFNDRRITKNGSDEIQMLFSANKGEPLQVLANVISGGELSRLMLEIKTQFTSQTDNLTIIFDEIDVGIGGKVATAVAEKIAHLSKDRQVLCVTHLPVIAAKAKYHYVVDKEYVDNRTITVIKNVQNEERVKEIMRMLGSFDDITKSQANRLLAYDK